MFGFFFFLQFLRAKLQMVNGSPVYPAGQMQEGTWFMTLQVAETPHDPKQGSAHFLLTQAIALGQSVFTVHSGRQFGGLPINSAEHEQDGISLTTRHSAFGPQGLG